VFPNVPRKIPYIEFIAIEPLSFIHSISCLQTDPKMLPKRFLHTVQSIAFSFKFQCPVFSLRTTSCLRLLPPVSFLSVFTSVTCLTT